MSHNYSKWKAGFLFHLSQCAWEPQHNCGGRGESARWWSWPHSSGWTEGTENRSAYMWIVACAGFWGGGGEELGQEGGRSVLWSRNQAFLVGFGANFSTFDFDCHKSSFWCYCEWRKHFEPGRSRSTQERHRKTARVVIPALVPRFKNVFSSLKSHFFI